MFFMLVALAIYIPRARDPGSWKWLTGDKTEEPEVAQARPRSAPAIAPTEIASAAVAPAKQPVVNDVVPSDELPLDEDREETDAFQEEAEVLIDRGLNLEGFEMAPYWRLVRWAQQSPADKLAPRAERRIAFNDFVQDTNKWRGKLVRLKLNARRVLKWDMPKTTPKDIPQLYEIWGSTDESQAWLYVVITPDLPAGLSLGNVYEEVTFYGYFLKLQGYHEGGAKPNAPALYAPLLIGRLNVPPPVPPPAVTRHPIWWWTAAGGVLAAGGALLWFIFRARPRRARVTTGTHSLPWHEVDEDEANSAPWRLGDDPAVPYEDQRNPWEQQREKGFWDKGF
jgi:hypothetical protein